MIKRICVFMLIWIVIILSLQIQKDYGYKFMAGVETKTSKQTLVDTKSEDKDQFVNVSISFAGDCTLGTDEKSIPYKDSFPDVFKRVKGDYAYFFKEVKHIFSKDDLTIVNLEGTFTKATEMAKKKWRFKGDPSYVNILKAGSIEMANISNNHIYDFKSQGYNDTIKTLKSAGIKYSGEGRTEFYKKKGITIASLGYNGWDTTIKKRVYDDIKAAKKKSELVIVSFHWGKEYTYYPNATQTELGRYCIDSGADVVVGHHPHVIQGIEKYKNKYIVYSLGNFCFGGNPIPPEKDSMIFQNIFTFKGNKIYKSEAKILPCSVSTSTKVNNFQPRILKDKEGNRVLGRIYEYSKKLKYGIKK